jgi:Leucine-rich repeat (LRR) protein
MRIPPSSSAQSNSREHQSGASSAPFSSEPPPLVDYEDSSPAAAAAPTSATTGLVKNRLAIYQQGAARGTVTPSPVQPHPPSSRQWQPAKQQLPLKQQQQPAPAVATSSVSSEVTVDQLKLEIAVIQALLRQQQQQQQKPSQLAGPQSQKHPKNNTRGHSASAHIPSKDPLLELVSMDGTTTFNDDEAEEVLDDDDDESSYEEETLPSGEDETIDESVATDNPNTQRMTANTTTANALGRYEDEEDGGEDSGQSGPSEEYSGRSSGSYDGAEEEYSGSYSGESNERSESIINPGTSPLLGNTNNSQVGPAFEPLSATQEQSLLQSARNAPLPTILDADKEQRDASNESSPNGSPKSAVVSEDNFWLDNRVLLLVSIVICLMIGGMVGLILWSTRDNNVTQDDDGFITESPTSEPTQADLPTSEPTREPDESLMIFQSALPDYTVEVLMDQQSSPQLQAYDWVTSEEQFADLPLDRQLLRFALATLYYATGGDEWSNNGGWLTPLNECFWWTNTGNSCQGTEYASLQLSENNLEGTLPLELGLLSSLSSLTISANTDLGGTVPYTISSINSLESIDLQNNNLGGTFPLSMTAMSGLTSLNLARNQLIGTIPEAVGAMTALTSLRLNQNSLTGNLPRSLRLMRLMTLSLQNNDLSGTISNAFYSNIDLQSIHLDNNNLYGSLSTRVGNLVDAVSLDMSGNALSGTLPTSLGQLTLLQSLIIGNNTLTGTIPTELGLLSSLQSLYISLNRITGSVPAEVCELVRQNNLLVSIDCTLVSCDCGCFCYN